MKINDDLMKWLSQWYSANCNGDWEHLYGIRIETLDNPGWSVEIDTKETSFVLKNLSWKLYEKRGNDWYGFQVENHTYRASGDPTKLEYLIRVFKELIEDSDNRF